MARPRRDLQPQPVRDRRDLDREFMLLRGLGMTAPADSPAGARNRLICQRARELAGEGGKPIVTEDALAALRAFVDELGWGECAARALQQGRRR